MSDRREALEKAWAEAETEEAPEEKVVETKAEEAPETESKEESEKPEETVEQDSAAPYKAEKKAAETPSKATRAPAQPAPQQPKGDGAHKVEGAAPTDKAPGSWKPEVREFWGKLPPEVRAEVSRRELQIQQTLSQTDNIRKFANEFSQVVQPHLDIIRAQNSTPIQAVHNLMNTAAGLYRGNQEQKAQIVAEIIGNYGIDLPTLDRVLSGVVKDGKVPSRSPVGQPEVPPWAQPMIQFMNEISQSRQEMQRRNQEEAQQMVEKYSAEKPFFDDLREDIADIMEFSYRRGQEMSVDTAYERALALRPELQNIIRQRNEAASTRNPVSEAAATLARARRASSTVAGGPSGEAVGGKPTPKNRREALERAWEESQSR